MDYFKQKNPLKETGSPCMVASLWLNCDTVIGWAVARVRQKLLPPPPGY